MKRGDELAKKYADERLAIVNKELSETSYMRHTKMKVNIFDGYDIESAYSDGYEKAVQDITQLADDMYLAAQYLTTDASRLHKAMEAYKQWKITNS